MRHRNRCSEGRSLGSLTSSKVEVFDSRTIKQKMQLNWTSQRAACLSNFQCSEVRVACSILGLREGFAVDVTLARSNGTMWDHSSAEGKNGTQTIAIPRAARASWRKSTQRRLDILVEPASESMGG